MVLQYVKFLLEKSGALLWRSNFQIFSAFISICSSNPAFWPFHCWSVSPFAFLALIHGVAIGNAWLQTVMSAAVWQLWRFNQVFYWKRCRCDNSVSVAMLVKDPVSPWETPGKSQQTDPTILHRLSHVVTRTVMRHKCFYEISFTHPPFFFSKLKIKHVFTFTSRGESRTLLLTA